MRTVSSYNYKKFFISATAVCALGSGLLLASGQQAHAQIVISQVYGGGGNAGAQYNRDFVELFNAGTTAVDLSAYSIQYAAATSTFNSITALTGTSIGANSYYLFAFGSGGSVGSALPTFSASSNTNISGANGKIALANNTTAVVNASSTNVVDFVGFGTANSFEGTVAPSGSNTTAIARRSNTTATAPADTNDNGADFFVVSPTPRGSGTNGFQPLDTPEPGTFALGLTALPILGGIGLRRRALSRKARVAAHA